jgi:polysaccharide export outer membrane protein
MLNSMTRSLLALTMVSVLGACSTLPRDGPSARAMERGSSSQNAAGSYAIYNLDYASTERIKLQPPRFMGSLVTANATSGEDLIGEGDLLDISIFEPSGALFGSGGVSAGLVRSGNQALPKVTVDRTGAVAVPFAGSVRVAGLNTTQAAAAIRVALAGKVANPQVVVSISENTFNTVTVLGEVREPGKAPLSMNAHGILDVIALRGGFARPPEDIVVSIQRNGQTYTAPLTAVTTEFGQNITLARGDQVNLIYRPRRYSTFGALGAISQQEMGPGALTLAGAISKVGGLDTNSANARSVLIFRFERPELAQALGIAQTPTQRGVPVVYRVNLEEGSGFFVANNFEIQPDDILFVPRSDSAELSKFFTLVQTFTRVIYDISVTSAVNVN